MKMNIREMFVEAHQNACRLIAEGKKIDWSEDVANGKIKISEMIGTADGAREFVQKVTFDTAAGRESVPLVYKQLFQTKTDANFPRTLPIDELGSVDMVFLEKLEGGEVKFGTISPGTTKFVKFHTWATGIEYSEDMVEYNETWRISDIGVAFGSSYNKLLNHLHMSPIISGTYVTTGGGVIAQAAAQKNLDNPVAQLVAYDTSIEKTLENALQILPDGAKLIINSSDRVRLEAAIASGMLADNTPNFVKRRLTPDDFIPYDGTIIKVGGKTYTYGGVTAGQAFLIVPATANFQELIKHDLRIDSGDGDLTRLIVAQMVGRARRAVAVSLGGSTGAIKIALQ